MVNLRVGRMRQVVPDSLSFYFEIVARDTVCEQATLELVEIETRAALPRLRARMVAGDPGLPLPRLRLGERRRGGR